MRKFTRFSRNAAEGGRNPWNIVHYRDKIVLATKFSIGFDPGSKEVNKPLIPDARPAMIRASVEGSLCWRCWRTWARKSTPPLDNMEMSQVFGGSQIKKGGNTP